MTTNKQTLYTSVFLSSYQSQRSIRLHCLRYPPSKVLPARITDHALRETILSQISSYSSSNEQPRSNPHSPASKTQHRRTQAETPQARLPHHHTHQVDIQQSARPSQISETRQTEHESISRRIIFHLPRNTQTSNSSSKPT